MGKSMLGMFLGLGLGLCIVALRLLLLVWRYRILWYVMTVLFLVLIQAIIQQH